MNKNIFQSQNAVRKLFPVVGASVSLVVFFIALASGINSTVNYFYPRERAYPRNIREMRSEILREYCPDRDKD